MDQKVSALLDLFREARAAEEWKRRRTWKTQSQAARRPYILQRLALPLQGKLPAQAPSKTRDHSFGLNPSTSNDPEISVWGSIHKQLWG